MLSRIAQITDRYIPELEGKKFLLAVSGGLDSVVLMHIFQQLRLNYVIAHCNFGLRGKESDGDEEFVRSLAEKQDVLFFSTRFDTGEVAYVRKISTQMAARDLRYEWFYELLKKNKIDFLVTAHHKNDQIETFLINLLRGCGIDGLSGMKVLDGKLFRPLLDCSKEEILAHANHHQLVWREDSSNQKTDYLRNKLRLDIIPQLREIAPAFEKVMSENIRRLNETGMMYRSLTEEKIKHYLIKNDFGFQINLKELSREKTPALILFEILRDFGFNYVTAENILKDHHDRSGKKFFSGTYRAVDHRGNLLLTRLAPKQIEMHVLEDFTPHIEFPVSLKMEKIPVEKLEIHPDPKYAHLDADLLKFPLHIRRWHEGDVFKPFGMKGRKKLSDYFIDAKFSLVEKENCWLLCSADQIVWLIGYRIDDKFRVGKNTKTVLKIEFLI